MVNSLLMKLGFIPSREKSYIIPSQVFVFLGYWFRTDMGIVLPPLDKFLRVNALAEELIQAQSVPVRWFLKFLGFINSLADVIPLWRLHIRPLQSFLLQCSPFSQNWDFPLLFDQSVRQASLWWTQKDNVLSEVPFTRASPSRTLYTDISMTVWGAYLSGQLVSGLWSQEERSVHINVLEMKSVLLAVSAFLPQLRDQEICLSTDNSTVVAYINNQGGTKSQTLCYLSRELLLFFSRTTFSF